MEDLDPCLVGEDLAVVTADEEGALRVDEQRPTSYAARTSDMVGHVSPGQTC